MMPENGGIGVFAHEYAHNLGADDLYAYVKGNTSAGFWTLMADDWTGYPIGYEPPSVDPWHLDRWGWLDPMVISDPGKVYEFKLGQASNFPGGDGVYRGAKIELPDGGCPSAVPLWQGSHYWWGGQEDLANGKMTTEDPLAVPAGGASSASTWSTTSKRPGTSCGSRLLTDGETWTTLTNANTKCEHDPGWIGELNGFPDRPVRGGHRRLHGLQRDLAGTRSAGVRPGRLRRQERLAAHVVHDRLGHGLRRPLRRQRAGDRKRRGDLCGQR